MSDYFSFYDLEPAFIIDEQLLRRKYLQFSREFHPDYYGLESEEKQAEALELSSKNNEAFKLLSDFDKRFAYILNVHGLLDEQKNKTALPQSFLFEMMEVNESLSELEFSFSRNAFEKLENDIKSLKNNLYKLIEPDLKNYRKESTDEKMLQRLLEYYLKKRYLNRLEERLNKFDKDKS